MNADVAFEDRNQGRVGVIVPSSNSNLEPDTALLLPVGVTAHFTRVGGYDVDAVPDSAAMQHLANASLTEPIALLMAAKMDVIAYGCASATLACGWEFDREMCRDIERQAGVPAVTTSGAMVGVLRDLGAQKIGFAAPYDSALIVKSSQFFASAGVDVVNSSNAGDNLSSAGQGCLTPRDAYQLGCAADHPDAQAIVLGCTDFRAVEAIELLQAKLGKPVITANQALIMASLALLGK